MSMKSVCLIVAMLLSATFESVIAANRLPKPVLEFVGYMNNQPVYRLDIRNPEKVKLSVIIRDTDGNILHEEALEGENISRKYCFLKEEIGQQDLIVEVTRSEKEAVVNTIRMDRRKMK